MPPSLSSTRSASIPSGGLDGQAPVERFAEAIAAFAA
jgi:hypothetical protein